MLKSKTYTSQKIMSRKIIYLTSILLPLFIVGCKKESFVKAELEPPYYNTSDSSTDPIQHYKSIIFNTYGTYLITAPTIRDYAYNFANKNKIDLTAPEQSEENLLHGIKILKEQFLNLYPVEFLKKNLPFSILLADKIIFTGYISVEDGVEPPRPEYYSYASSSFIAVSGIRKNMGKNPKERLDSIRGDVNARFWLDYIEGIKGGFEVSKSFYEVSKGRYKKDYFDDPATINYYKDGFISYNKVATIYDSNDGWYTELPDEELDLRQWVEFIFRTPKTKIADIINAPGNEKMLKKYEILKQSFLDVGFNIESLSK
jgi:hypothetical protein